MDAARLTLVENSLFSLARHYQWQLEAWAIFRITITSYLGTTPNQLT
jgi:hypothetical protein